MKCSSAFFKLNIFLRSIKLFLIQQVLLLENILRCIFSLKLTMYFLKIFSSLQLLQFNNFVEIMEAELTMIMPSLITSRSVEAEKNWELRNDTKLHSGTSPATYEQQVRALCKLQKQLEGKQNVLLQQLRFFIF